MKAKELKFLVVDDDDFQRETLIYMLRFLGAKSIKQAGDGKQALDILKQKQRHPINIVLCDLEMPGMDGLEFFRHMGNTHPDISLIIISALDAALITSVEKMARAYGLRLLGAVAKPVDLSRLKDLISLHESVQAKVKKELPDKLDFALDEIIDGLQKNQFEPFFQPKVDVATGRIIGAEALARWIHPEHGVIAPYAFINLLECSGNINELTFIMLKKTADACRQLHADGHELTLAVNISRTSLTDTALANRIFQIIRDARVDPQYFILEITETATMTEVAHALENLARLRMYGFGLSIDDYGTGYSSMQQIARIAFSELKIDQSFVQGFSENGPLSIIVQSSIDMAHKLRIQCLAEGVETEQEWTALKRMGCDSAQGYYIAKPMDLASFSNFCADRVLH